MADELNGGGEGGDNTQDPNANEGGGGDPKPVVIQMTQKELDAKMAHHKRGLQRELAEAKQKAGAFDSLQGQVSELLKSGIIDEVDDLEDFRTAASQTIEEARSETERELAKNQKMEVKLKEANERADSNQQRFEAAMIQRAISDSAADLVVEGHGREGAVEYFQLKLSSHCQVGDDGTVAIKWDVKDEDTGRVESKSVPIKEALQAMEAQPTKYGRYFRSTVNGGAGGETVDGIGRTSDGNVDFANMDFQKFKELAKKNPGLLADSAEKMTF